MQRIEYFWVKAGGAGSETLTEAPLSMKESSSLLSGINIYETKIWK